MGNRKSPDKAPDRVKKWDKVFNALVKLSQNLKEDRQFLESRVKSLQEVIHKMKPEQKVESAKAELMLVLKEREAFVYKHRYENADDELSDFREWFDYVSQICSEPKSTLDDVSNKGQGEQNKALQDEVRWLKSEIENYKLEKNSEISALLAEKNFVWNQYKKMEADVTEKLMKKCDEVKHADENVRQLINRAEQLQLSNEKLRWDFAKMESESVQKSEEICRLLKEIELLKSRSGSMSPLLHLCGSEAASSHRGGKNSVADDRVIEVKKESVPFHTLEKMSRTKQSAHKSTGGKAPRKQFIVKGSIHLKRKAIESCDHPRHSQHFSHHQSKFPN